MSVALRHLRAFECVARLGSFTRAAEELKISQPALTMTVRQLEGHVGTSLFDRTTRRVSLTPQGQDLVPVARRLLGDFDLAIEDARSLAKRRSGRIGIASVISVSVKVLPGVIRRFCAAHPYTSVHLYDGNSSDVRGRVRRDEVDLGFCSMDSNDPDLDFKPLFRDQIGLLARVDHQLLRMRRQLTWADLDGHDFLGLAQGTATRPILESVVNLPASVRSPNYEVSNQSTLEAMIEEGMGVTIVPALMGSRGANAPLRFRPLGDPVMWRTIHVVTRKGRKLSSAASALEDLLTAEIRQICGGSRLIQSLDRPLLGSRPGHRDRRMGRGRE
ncbi:MAG: LysR family transcriptional regulator [Alphaproteobacteria bacterium]|nr:LysR family transcriptional regulator [Alphaproteobacteria bacterium]